MLLRWRSQNNPASTTTRLFIYGGAGLVRPTCFTPSAITLSNFTRNASSVMSLQRTSSTNSSMASAANEWTSSKRVTDPPMSYCSTMCSSSKERNKSSKSSSIRSTRSMSRANRWCSVPIGTQELVDARGPPAITFRVGSTHGHPTSRCGDPNSHPSQEHGQGAWPIPGRCTRIHC